MQKVRIITEKGSIYRFRTGFLTGKHKDILGQMEDCIRFTKPVKHPSGTWIKEDAIFPNEYVKYRPDMKLFRVSIKSDEEIDAFESEHDVEWNDQYELLFRIAQNLGVKLVINEDGSIELSKKDGYLRSYTSIAECLYFWSSLYAGNFRIKQYMDSVRKMTYSISITIGEQTKEYNNMFSSLEEAKSIISEKVKQYCETNDVYNQEIYVSYAIRNNDNYEDGEEDWIFVNANGTLSLTV